MKLSSILRFALVLTTVAAVYPPVDLGDASSDDLVTIQKSTTSNSVYKAESDNATGKPKSETISPFYSFYLAASMIVVSEIGDKTFLIAAIMAMRHPRMVVFSAASTALVLMTVLSGLIGNILPQLLSPRFTRFAAAVLFLVFGVNLLREGLATPKEAGVEEELAEVEEEIAAVELNDLNGGDLEQGTTEKKSSIAENIKNLLAYVSTPIWYQTFTMTFLGEWGDRSQITTIAMAAGGEWLSIVLGGSLGHIACTLLAVLGGQYISTKISLRTVMFGGCAAFFVFSFLYGYSAIYEN